MMTWQKKDYGFHFTFSSPITEDEASKWSKEVKQAATQVSTEFYVFVDLRKFILIPPECRHIIEDVQSFFKENGMKRSVVIVNEPITAMQVKLVASETNIRDWERYIESPSNPDWEQQGMNWLEHGIEPDDNV